VLFRSDSFGGARCGSADVYHSAAGVSGRGSGGSGLNIPLAIEEMGVGSLEGNPPWITRGKRAVSRRGTREKRMCVWDSPEGVRGTSGARVSVGGARRGTADVCSACSYPLGAVRAGRKDRTGRAHRSTAGAEEGVSGARSGAASVGVGGARGVLPVLIVSQRRRAGSRCRSKSFPKAPMEYLSGDGSLCREVPVGCTEYRATEWQCGAAQRVVASHADCAGFVREEPGRVGSTAGTSASGGGARDTARVEGSAGGFRSRARASGGTGSATSATSACDVVCSPGATVAASGLELLPSTRWRTRVGSRHESWMWRECVGGCPDQEGSCEVNPYEIFLVGFWGAVV